MLLRSKLTVVTLIAIIVAAVVAAPAGSALFFFFSPKTAKPGERVTIRTAGTPANFRLRQRLRPFQEAMRLYLVPNAIADEVRSRRDPRLRFIGQLVPDRNGNGLLRFTVPRLKPGRYAAAAYCPGCARNSRGRTFFVLGVGKDVLPRYRAQMQLRVGS